METLEKDLLVNIDKLTEREAKVIKLRYGLDDGQMRSCEEAAQLCSCSAEEIRAVEAKAIRRLRHMAAGANAKDYLD